MTEKLKVKRTSMQHLF